MIELDCTITVTTTPMSIDSIALEPRKSVIMTSTRPCAAARITLTRKYSAEKMRSPLTTSRNAACPSSAGNSHLPTASIGAKPSLSAVLIGLW